MNTVIICQHLQAILALLPWVFLKDITSGTYKLCYTCFTHRQSIQVQLKGLHVIFFLSRRNHIQPSQPLITEQSLHLSSINLSFKEALPRLLITQRNKIFCLAVLRQLCPWRWLCQILRIFTHRKEPKTCDEFTPGLARFLPCLTVCEPSVLGNSCSKFHKIADY